jgi:hypothetical protein
VIQQHETLGVTVQGGGVDVVIAHGQRARITRRDEAVQAPAIDLPLVLVKPVHGIRHALMDRDGAVNRKGRVGQLRGKARVRHRRARSRVDDRRKQRVGMAIRIGLGSGGCRRVQAFRAREVPIQVVEAVILHVDHDDVPDALGSGHHRRWWLQIRLRGRWARGRLGAGAAS